MFFKSISQLNEHIYKLLSYIFCQTDKIVQRQEINHLLRTKNVSPQYVHAHVPIRWREGVLLGKFCARTK